MTRKPGRELQPSRRADLLGAWHFWGVLALLALGALLFYQYGDSLVRFVDRGDDLRAWIESFGPWAPLAYIGIFTAQIVLAPLPGHFLGIAAGYVFGGGWAFLYSIVGLTLGAAIAMTIGRRLGRPLLQRYFSEAEIRRWERKLRVRSPVTWVLLCIFPVPDLVMYVAGLTSAPMRRLLPAIVAGRGIGLLVATTLGGWSARLPAEWVLAKWLALAALALVIGLYQRRIRLAMYLASRRVRRAYRQWQQRRLAARAAAASSK